MEKKNADSPDVRFPKYIAFIYWFTCAYHILSVVVPLHSALDTTAVYILNMDRVWGKLFFTLSEFQNQRLLTALFILTESHVYI